MSKIMALDIETANYSYEIGGWDKTHLFEPVVVATWDGENAHIFSKEDVDGGLIGGASLNGASFAKIVNIKNGIKQK